MNSMDKEQNFIVEIKGEMCRLGYLLLISNLIKDTDGASSEKMARKLMTALTNTKNIDWTLFKPGLSNTALLSEKKGKGGALVENIIEFSYLLGFYDIKKRKLGHNARISNKLWDMLNVNPLQEFANPQTGVPSYSSLAELQAKQNSVINPLVLKPLQQVFLLKCIFEKDSLALLPTLQYVVSQSPVGRSQFMDYFMDGDSNPDDAIFPKILQQKIDSLKPSSLRKQLKKDHKDSLTFNKERVALQQTTKWNKSSQYAKYRHQANPRIEWMVDLGIVKKSDGNAVFTASQLASDLLHALEQLVSDENLSFYDLVLPVYFQSLKSIEDWDQDDQYEYITEEIIESYNQITKKSGLFQTSIPILTELVILNSAKKGVHVKTEQCSSGLKNMKDNYPNNIRLNQDRMGNLLIIQLKNSSEMLKN